MFVLFLAIQSFIWTLMFSSLGINSHHALPTVKFGKKISRITTLAKFFFNIDTENVAENISNVSVCILFDKITSAIYDYVKKILKIDLNRQQLLLLDTSVDSSAFEKTLVSNCDYVESDILGLSEIFEKAGLTELIENLKYPIFTRNYKGQNKFVNLLEHLGIDVDLLLIGDGKTYLEEKLNLNDHESARELVLKTSETSLSRFQTFLETRLDKLRTYFPDIVKNGILGVSKSAKINLLFDGLDEYL